MKIKFTQGSIHKNSVVVVPVASDGIPGKGTARKNRALAAIAGQNSAFRKGERKTMVVPTEGATYVLLNIGDPDKLEPEGVRKLGKDLYKTLKDEGAQHATLDLTGLKSPEAAAHLADAVYAASYVFSDDGKHEGYKTLPEGKVPPLKRLDVLTPDSRAEAIFTFNLRGTTESAAWAADRVNEDPEHLTPQSFAEKIRDVMLPLGVRVTIFDDTALRNMGMNALRAIGRGSANEPCLVTLEHDGSEGKQRRRYVGVGKGITFDSGGLNIKGAGIEEMHMDMGGAAAIAGGFLAAVRRGTTGNIAAVLPLAENMTGADAFKPGGIVTSYSGRTIEINDTDAEGRVVLADGIAYARRGMKGDVITTAATLTGACCVALGLERAGVFTPDDRLFEAFDTASRQTGEKIWRLPVDAEYENLMTKGTRADIRNYDPKRWGGASTAAAFLNFFAKQKLKSQGLKGKAAAVFGHVDLAGPGMTHPGWGVRLFDNMIAQHERNALRR